MVAIRLSVVIGADRRLVVNLPDDTPLGPAELEIRLVETTAAEEREALRARLLAEGLIVRPEDMGIPDDLEYVSDEEVEAMVLPPGTPTSEELIDLDPGATLSEFFVDTSALAKRYLTETGAKWVRRLMRPSAGNIIMVAELSRVEMSSLLNRHLRFGTLPPRSLKRIGNNFLRHLQSEYFVIPIDRQLLIVASELTNKHPLRALDAIQLACAVRAYNIAPQNPLTFISADTTLLATAASEGFTIDNPNNHP